METPSHPGTATAAGGTHPIGMHSCFNILLNDFLVFVHDKFCMLILSASSDGHFLLILPQRQLFWYIDYSRLINAKIFDNKHLLKARVVVCLYVSSVVK